MLLQKDQLFKITAVLGQKMFFFDPDQIKRGPYCTSEV
jgi:hypothetical protein